MQSGKPRRLALGAVAVACSIVFLLGLLQLFGLMDDVNVLLGAMLGLTALVFLSAWKGWLPTRRRR